MIFAELGEIIRMKVYVEKYDSNEGLLLIDFISRNDFGNFCYEIGQDYLPADERSMLLIENIFFKSGQEPKEGRLYSLSFDNLKQFKWVKEPSELSGEFNPDIGYSDIIAFRSSNWKNQIDSIFTKPLKYSINLNSQVNLSYLESMIQNEELPFCGVNSLNDNINVIVRNVGQGNWNEVYDTNGCKLIYDLGASIKLTNIQVRALIHSSNSFGFNPSLIISHWDIDHYRAILQLEPIQIWSLCCAYVPVNIPNLTSERALKKLINSGMPVFLIPESPCRIISRRISLEKILSGPHYSFFRGEKSSDRNKSGLVLALWKNKEGIILSGDHYYHQIFEDVVSSIPIDLKLNIVTPHHGGKAGSLRKYRKGKVKANIAITSTGDNNYGHPFDINKKQLERIGFQWERTDELNKDIIIKLT